MGKRDPGVQCTGVLHLALLTWDSLISYGGKLCGLSAHIMAPWEWYWILCMQGCLSTTGTRDCWGAQEAVRRPHVNEWLRCMALVLKVCLNLFC